MNLNQINPKNFILALFKRDDGERLLLGAGLYEFRDGLQHFQPNIIANDIVEKQGTDGQLLAGQVLRSATQPFDGYIGDATTTRPDIEDARRAFIQFFQTNHRYKVIYILPDGGAIQRQNGYLVDAPSVPEMTQKFPEYHVALAFEDIHYYSYAENPDGSETYAQTYEIDPSGTLTGGLVWIANGVEWDGPGRALQALKGATFQQTYTGVNLIDIVNCTGKTDRGVTGTPNADGTFTISGTALSTGNANLIEYKAISPTLPAGDYTFQISEPLPRQFYIHMTRQDGTTQNIIIAAGTTEATGTFTQAFKGFDFRFNVENGVEYNATIKMQLQSGATSTAIEPYVGGQPSPSPQYPQPIRTVTGSQTITIGGTAYTLDLGTTELNDLGNGYQDEIAYDGAEWKLRKVINTKVYDGINQGFDTRSNTNVTGKYRFQLAGTIGERSIAQSSSTGYFDGLCNILQSGTRNMTFQVQYLDGNTIAPRSTSGYGNIGVVYSAAISGMTLDEANAWLTTHNMVITYPLATPTETTITDAGLIAQLDAIKAALEDGGAISITPSGSNLAVVMDAPENGTGGAIWEDSGGTAAQPVTNNGIATVSPIWTVSGEAENPSITNETTGQTLTFTGTIPNGQTLVVDCGAQTANIAGVDVKAQMSGQWITIEPGTNLIAYSGASTNGPATIKWNEVIE